MTENIVSIFHPSQPIIEPDLVATQTLMKHFYGVVISIVAHEEFLGDACEYSAIISYDGDDKKTTHTVNNWAHSFETRRFEDTGAIITTFLDCLLEHQNG